MVQKINMDVYGEGQELPVTQTEATMLLTFRRSAFSKDLENVLVRALGISREEYEGNVASEERRQRVQGVKDVIDVLFRAKLIKKEG